MNILVLASEYPHEKDTNADRTKIVGSFAREWVRQGHRVVVIVDSTTFPAVYYAAANRLKRLLTRSFDVSRAPDRLWTKRFRYDDHGVTVENLPMVKYIPHGRFSKAVIRKQLDTILDLLAELDFRPDVVTGHWVNPQLMLVPALAEHYQAKSAFVFHADYTKEICDKFNAQQYLDRIDHVGFRSRSAAQAAGAYLRLRQEPFIAASGIPDQFIAQHGALPRRDFASPRLRLITAARLVEYKKIDAIIEAAAKQLGQGFELVIAGDGPLKEKLWAHAQTHRVAENVKLIGQIPREELQERMRTSDVFVLISKRETFGLVYIEAMLHGCLVIASRFGGVDGIIEDGVNGFLCEEGSAAALAETFGRIARMTAAEKQQMSAAAHDTALQYSDSLAARRYLDHAVGQPIQVKGE